MSTLDCLFIAPPTGGKIYQELSNKYSPIETPTWALLLAESCRSVEYNVGISDLNIEKTDSIVNRIKLENPKYICIVVYGPNPNSGTMMMGGALEFADIVKKNFPNITIIFVGSHVSALPYEVLKEKSVDIVLTNEGVYALRNILGGKSLQEIKGIGYDDMLNPPEKLVPQSRMDLDLPGYSWDLLPYKHKPLDLYKCHFWHSGYNHEKRSPFAAIYTSLGCQFRCSFCMVNILNKNDNADIGIASNYAGMRFWSPDFIVHEIEKLYKMGVIRIRLADEMFLLNRKYYVPFCENIIKRGLGNKLYMWAYSRIDTVNDVKQLKLIRKAGIRWLCLGIESGDMRVRLEVTKGKFEDVDIKSVIDICHENDIEIIANYMFGLPNDTYESMTKTFTLSLELCTIVWNAYATMALPGSELYKEALDKDIPLPDSYEGYSFHSYETLPLPTSQLTSAEVLEFRDWAWSAYHSYPPFLRKVEEKYGIKQRKNIETMTDIILKRKLLGD
ncbi:MAG: B12-binding domain-containing radical SAM protein [Parcubacteria group bacterium]|nr:B12-binding domain-containing radical SAM protein [Parcubacteria group bacterium]